MRLGFALDNRRCIGCHACTVACKAEHAVPLGVHRTWVKYVEKGRFPHVRRYFQVLRCNHCDRPPCVEICPVGAMFRRKDGVVDFDPSRCIGCKTCLQACPYDAIHVDPERKTASKCNFCAHRVDCGIEPACVAACPERAIVCGDLDDPTSEIAALLARQPARVRKPEQGTRPKLWTIGGEDGALVPTLPRYAASYLWAERRAEGAAVRLDGDPAVDPLLLAAYHVEHLRPWGWQVPGFFWTKSIAAGALLVPTAAALLGRDAPSLPLLAAMSAVAVVATGVTAALIVSDLSRPLRFWTILPRARWSSWVARGSWILVAYGGIAALLGLTAALGLEGPTRLLLLPALALAALAAAYTAGLLSQCEGRDLWQNALLPIHFLVSAGLAGAAVLAALPEGLAGPGGHALAAAVLGTTFVDHLLVMVGLYAMSPATDHAAHGLRVVLRGPLAPLFWGGAVLVGGVLPAALLLLGQGPLAVPLAALLALVGLFAFEGCLVMGGQGAPNS